MGKYSWYIYIVIAIVMQIVAGASSYAGQVKDEQWKQLTSDDAFYYKDMREGVEANAVANDGITNFLMAVVAFFVSPVGKMILWLMFFGFVGWVLFRVFIHDDFGIMRNKKNPAAEIEYETEKTPAMESNWRDMMLKAAKDKDYTMAIRYGYMWTLQALNTRNQIAYEDDKTNLEYYREIKKDEYRQNFRQVYKIYEYAWYGRYDMSEQEYIKLHQAAEKINSTIA